MRMVILALAIGGAAGAASAQQDSASGPNGMTRFTDRPTLTEPSGVRKRAEDVVRAGLSDPKSAQFRSVAVLEAASARHNAFTQRIAGPLSIVCGQYDSKDAATGEPTPFAWFFIAIKRGQVLWADVDLAADGPGIAYDNCKGAGLAD